MSPRVRAVGIVAWVIILALACARCGTVDDTLRPLNCSIHLGTCFNADAAQAVDGGLQE